MKIIILFLALTILPSTHLGITDEPTGHPLESGMVPNSTFGIKHHPVLEVDRLHAGVDFVVKEGTAVYATADGTVKLAEENNGYGKHIRIQHVNGFETIYAHLASINVVAGEEVKNGQEIGLTGNTGLSSGPHLHYEIRKDDEPVDPAEYLP